MCKGTCIQLIPILNLQTPHITLPTIVSPSLTTGVPHMNAFPKWEREREWEKRREEERRGGRERGEGKEGKEWINAVVLKC